MKSLIGLLVLSALSAQLSAQAPAVAAAGPVYELRIYYTAPGKMPDLLKRFREHTCALFERHGMVNIGYWLPVEAKDQDKLYYVLEHKSRDAAKQSWKDFGSDPEWKTVQAASEAAGKIVLKVDSTFLEATDYSADPRDMKLRVLSSTHVYELRTYTTNEGKLADLDARFRNHTTKLFEKHGMTNILYTHPIDADKGAGHILIYFLAHSSVDAAKKSWDAFRADPEWIKVRDASEANGKILVHNPDSIFLTPTDFSPLK